MDNSRKNLCIVNDKDEIIGTQKALRTHFKPNILLHRAFSVFIFNSKGELLLQKRSKEKLVFPGMYANSVCSHPFINDLSFIDPVYDCKMHAIERINYELGITSIREEDLIFFERFLYFADDIERFGRKLGTDVRSSLVTAFKSKVDGVLQDNDDFAEYELDYLFYCFCDEEPKPRETEVEKVEYVNEERLKNLLMTEKCAPWFDLIINEIEIFNLKKIVK
ncbi:isopentenyl-diphosphate delta-isomerase idi1 [Conglomerata obtusa]